MPLAAGIRLGSYEILAKLGEGGMGEVYRARDTKLNRDVALKILPDAFTLDGDRVARFRREAQVLASLNHPNIAHIYGFEDSGSTHALVLELVDGPTLADRIAKGPLSLDEALPIAKQVAEALEAAHEQGIIHRDLKPANIKVRDDGTVKVLDFGLAKALEPASAISPMMTSAPTITTPAMMTGVGMILGTAAYMSPEQAKGRPADKRSDVWAFGCVLYEMLTGRRAFEGEDIADTLANVLKTEPGWSRLEGAPQSVREVVRRCLQRDRNSRIPDMTVVRYLLDSSPSSDSQVGEPRRSRVLMWQLVSAVMGTVAIVLAGRLEFRQATPLAAVRFQIRAPEKTVFTIAGRLGSDPIVSPDGTKIAFTARTDDLKAFIWVRSLDAVGEQLLPGTDGAQSPFWSPDSRFIAFVANGKLLKIAATGGPVQTICECGGGRGGTWNADGVIVLNGGQRANYSLLRVSSAGGQGVPVLARRPDVQDVVAPWFLPDGKHLLVQIRSPKPEVTGVYVVGLDTGDSKRILDVDSGAVFDPKAGYLMFVRQGTLFAQTFSPRTLSLADEPFPIAEGVQSIPDFRGFSVANDGTLAYANRSSNDLGQMTWFDRQGNATGTVGPAGTYIGVEISPDGSKIASHRHEGDGGDIWMTDVARGTTSRFTFDAKQDNSSPVFSPDGMRLAFGSLREGKWGIYAKPVTNSGDEEVLFQSDLVVVPMTWSPDGRSIVYWTRNSGFQLSLLPLSPNAKPTPLTRPPFSESHAQISPNGRWLAYESDETGRREVYVRAFPPGPGKWQISTTGGTVPRWRKDGRELFYQDANYTGKLHAADVRTDASNFEPGASKELFDLSADGYVVPFNHTSNWHNYAVSADGQRFLVPRPDPATRAETLQAPITVVLNWSSGVLK